MTNATPFDKSLSDLARLLQLRLGVSEALRECARSVAHGAADGCIIVLFDPVEHFPQIKAAAHRTVQNNQTLKSIEGYRPTLSESDGLSIALRYGRCVRQACPHAQTDSHAYLPIIRGAADAPFALPKFGYRAIPLKDNNGIAGALVLLFDDHDDRLPMNAELLAELVSGVLSVARLAEETQEAMQARSDFVSIASHELKTPLTALKLDFQLLLKLMNSPEKALHAKLPELVNKGEQELERIERLITDFSDLSRISRGGLLLNTESLDLSATIHHLVARFQESGSTKAPINIQVSPGIVGEWDRLRIEQVVQNLLSNAAKYGKGGPIDVSLHADTNWAEISVRDYGIGIAPEDQKRIFQLFERAAVSPHVGGLGIGLYVVQELIRMHGGTIEVQSKLDQGANFIVKLPRVPSLDVKTAIQVHHRWKKRIMEHISGSSLEKLRADQIRPDHLCTLGNWIYRILATTPPTPDMTRLQDLHRRFHAVASKVIDTFETKGRAAAEALLSEDSEYAVLSKEIIELLEKMHSP